MRYTYRKHTNCDLKECFLVDYLERTCEVTTQTNRRNVFIFWFKYLKRKVQSSYAQIQNIRSFRFVYRKYAPIQRMRVTIGILKMGVFSILTLSHKCLDYSSLA